MKKLLLLLILTIISNSAFAANNSTIEGVWRGMLSCEWEKDSWGGGEYEPGNAKFSGAFNFTIVNDSSSEGSKKFTAKNWIDKGSGFRVIESFNISENKIIVSDIWRKKEETKMTWEGSLLNDNTMMISSDDQGSCKGKAYKSEKIVFDSYAPKTLLDYVDGVENDKKYEIPGLLTFPDTNQEKYPVMILIVNSGCGYAFREYSYGKDILDQGVAVLELDNCKSRGLSKYNPIGAGNFNKLTPWMGAADTLYALKFLQDHPRVDINSIGVMGFSYGGQVALWTGIDVVRKSIVGEQLDFALRVPFYPFCRQFDDPRYSKNKLHIFTGELDAAPPIHCESMINSFNKSGLNASMNVYPGAYHNFDDLFYDAPVRMQHRDWYVTDQCNLWIDSDHRRSWRLDGMKIDLDQYPDWNVSADPYYNEYKSECELNGVKMGRNDSAARHSALKLIDLMNQHLK
ncbi:MAG: dienelactone hydrolase family protein [Candidatus Pseudothioglobus sp.]